MTDGFQRALDHIRANADTPAATGRLFERLMKAYLHADPLYRDRFSTVWLWSEWAASRPDVSGSDIGIDLVAQEREGGVCAIQCKCYAPGTRLAKAHLDSFIAASAREPFTARIIVDTGDAWGSNAVKTIEGLKPPCTVLRFADLATRPIDWPDLVRDAPETLSVRREVFQLRPHQRQARDDVVRGLAEHDRGKLIMACGTGKTLVALRTAESVAGTGGRVLYLVPSISLLQQSMREWAEQRTLTHRYIGICSDTRAGRSDEDASLAELEIPVTTDTDTIAHALARTPDDVMTVVFCTYHSIGLVEHAQGRGAPALDLVICDEAHRTTGVERPGDRTSPFVRVHDAQAIRARKRLYMTATPRLYTETARAKAARHDVDVFSMDDVRTYGLELHRLPFSRAIEQGLLADYKVLVLAMSEQHVDATLQAHLAAGGSEINLTDAAKIIGCWQALQDPERGRGPARHLRRAIAFTHTIRASRRLETHWDELVTQAIEQLPQAERTQALRCETRHVDGQSNALTRKSRIEWLKGPNDTSDGTCRILSNARCLSEGIDVPALDAVLFMSPRRSQVDIVQAVGRAMRKTDEKKEGYIVLPIAVPAEVDPVAALDDNERFAPVWGVLRALRSHDDRFNAEINHLDLNRTPTDRIIFSAGDSDGASAPETLALRFPPLDLPPGALYAKIVERCGDRKYWETWAKDVAEIFSRLVLRIEGLLERPDSDALRERLKTFHEALKTSINASVDHADAIEMIAQHLLTRPVFEALFEHYDFAGSNPVARALDTLGAELGALGLENETRDLERFYESVRQRARGLDNPRARQRVLMELYERFFSTAMKKDADRLGIVYTPVEIVDFILASADHVAQSTFGRGLSDENVHVLDPFTGTAIFLVRLLQSTLISEADLERKYHQELHANEIVLLAYYIAAIHIEEAFHERRGGEEGEGEKNAYEPFNGIVLTDTFNLHTERTGFARMWLPDNSERAERQQKLPIQIIVGNPPWSVGQKSSVDNNPNVSYPEIQGRIAETYATRSTAVNKNSLYDTYKLALRWASDRIGRQGVIAFVTNGSWIDGNADVGIRACLAEEFNTVHVVNLRGNQRTQGERSRQEGGKVFGQGSRAPVAITILAKSSSPTHRGCRILYHDIGDYLTREDKLKRLREWGSIAGVEDWKEIAPDPHHDWIGQRDKAFQTFYPLGSKEAKAGRTDDAIFRLYSRGYETSRDAYIYSFSRETCAKNARLAIEDYMGAMNYMNSHPECSTDEATASHSQHIRWDQELTNKMTQGRRLCFSKSLVREAAYRPFVKQYLYAEPGLAKRPSIMRSMFPSPDTGNRAICVPGVGSTKPFSILMVDTMPALQVEGFPQCFPRYRHERQDSRQTTLPAFSASSVRVDNISDAALRAFQTRYGDDEITKDTLFDYVYGILHAPEYRERFANDLAKSLPRVPLVQDVQSFHAFAEAGRQLCALHLGYETCKTYPLSMELSQGGDLRPEHCRLGPRAMRYADKEKTILVVNDHLRLAGIPPETHEYEVNGRSPLGWLIDRYQITQDRESRIVNDPNTWFDDPRDLVATICRIVHLSVETVRIIKGLPMPFGSEEPPDAESAT